MQITTEEDFAKWEKNSPGTVKVKVCYIDLAKDIAAGVALSQIVYWHLPGKDGKSRLRVKKQGRLWIAKRYEDWWHECRIKQRTLDRKLEMLEKRGLILTSVFRFNGSPTLHVAIQWDEFLGALSEVLSQEVHQPDKVTVSNLPTRALPSCQIGRMENARMADSLTDSTEKITKEITVGVSLGNSVQEQFSPEKEFNLPATISETNIDPSTDLHFQALVYCVEAEEAILIDLQYRDKIKEVAQHLANYYTPDQIREFHDNYFHPTAPTLKQVVREIKPYFNPTAQEDKKIVGKKTKPNRPPQKRRFPTGDKFDEGIKAEFDGN